MKRLLVAFGQAVNTTRLYGVDHRVTQRAIEESFTLLESLLEQLPQLTWSVVEGAWMADTTPLNIQNPLVQALEKNLTEAGLGGFSLS